MNINFAYANIAMVRSLGPGPAVLFGWLTVVTNLPSGTCTASYETIAEDMGVDRKTIQTWKKCVCCYIHGAEFSGKTGFH